jgi:hypothetical protein
MKADLATIKNDVAGIKSTTDAMTFSLGFLNVNDV